MRGIERVSVEGFLASPVGRYTAGRSVLVACPDPALRICIVWGCPDATDARDLLGLLQVVFHSDLNRRVDALTDISRMNRIDPGAFYALIGGLMAQRPRFAAHIRRQAFVRPPSLVGAVVAGMYDIVGRTFPVRTFASRRAGLEWLGRRDASELAEWLETMIPLELERERLVDEVARLIEANPGVTSLAAVAAALRTSGRVLQRRLQSAGTTFRRELNGARVRAAQRLLLDDRFKVAAIAREIGVSSMRRFRDLFREATGTTPGRWRKTGGQPIVG